MRRLLNFEKNQKKANWLKLILMIPHLVCQVLEILEELTLYQQFWDHKSELLLLVELERSQSMLKIHRTKMVTSLSQLMW